MHIAFPPNITLLVVTLMCAGLLVFTNTPEMFTTSHVVFIMLASLWASFDTKRASALCSISFLLSVFVALWTTVYILIEPCIVRSYIYIYDYPHIVAAGHIYQHCSLAGMIIAMSSDTVSINLCNLHALIPINMAAVYSLTTNSRKQYCMLSSKNATIITTVAALAYVVLVYCIRTYKKQIANRPYVAWDKVLDYVLK